MTIKKTPDTDPDQNLKGQKFPKEERVEEHFTQILLGLREEFLFSQREGAEQFSNKFTFINAKFTTFWGETNTMDLMLSHFVSVSMEST